MFIFNKSLLLFINYISLTNGLNNTLLQAKKDEEEKLEGFVAITGDKPEEEKDSLLKNVLWQMDNDRKTAALKQLQGHMWREAYKTGTVKGQ